MPTLWINNLPYSYETDGKYGSAYDIAFLGDDIYTVGEIITDTNIKKLVIWKNFKIFAELPFIGEARGSAIAINEKTGDIYVITDTVQTDQNYVISSKVFLWKNGVSTELSNATYSCAHDIEIYNNDVYIVGEILSQNSQRATLWKNGAITYLTDGKKRNDAFAITIVNNDVFIAGREADRDGIYTAKYWKNGVETNLTNGKDSALASSIGVIGNDIYIGGYENYYAKIWKNGIATIQGNEGEGAINSLAVFDDMIYSVGNYSFINQSQVMWDSKIIFKASGCNFQKIYIR
jgi:hypothetical protein